MPACSQQRAMCVFSDGPLVVHSAVVLYDFIELLINATYSLRHSHTGRQPVVGGVHSSTAAVADRQPLTAAEYVTHTH